MQLALSSSAAPDLPLAELLEGCGRRGLSGLELVEGDEHGVAAASAGESERLAAERSVRLVGLLCRDATDRADMHCLRLAARLDAPLILPATEVAPERLRRLGRRAAADGVRLLLLHLTDVASALRLREVVETLPPGASGLAWQVDPAADEPDAVPEVLRVARGALEYIRLRGGGPESAQQTGMGVGALMARLALSRYAGPLVLTPGDPRYHYAWRAWLGRAGGWGCGSKQSDPSLVSLPLGAER